MERSADMMLHREMNTGLAKLLRFGARCAGSFGNLMKTLWVPVILEHSNTMMRLIFLMRAKESVVCIAGKAARFSPWPGMSNSLAAKHSSRIPRPPTGADLGREE